MPNLRSSKASPRTRCLGDDGPDPSDRSSPSYYGPIDKRSLASEASAKSMTRSTVVSQFSKLSIKSKSSKGLGKRIIGRVKSVRRKKDKKKTLEDNASEMESVPETVSARTNRLSAKLSRSSQKSVSSKGRQIESGNVHPVIHVVLFLVDPKATRFEILLLDFDSSRARVRDVLAQIKLSSKDDLFRTQRFSGIADEDGCEMIDSRRLCDYTTDWAVAVAIPDGMTSMESAAIAGPLMKDPRVSTLLQRHQSSMSVNAASTDENPSSPMALSSVDSSVLSLRESSSKACSTSTFSLLSVKSIFTLMAVVLAVIICQQLLGVSLKLDRVVVLGNSEYSESNGNHSAVPIPDFDWLAETQAESKEI